MGEETWIQEAEKNVLFRNMGRGAEAARLLEISPTNRILVDRNQAIILLIGRLEARYYMKQNPEYVWMNQVYDDVEEHQLTMAGISREQFMKVAIAQYQGDKNKAKNELENLVK